MTIKGIKKGDTALILSGKDKGKSAKILKVFGRDERVVLEGLNLVNRRVRPKKAGEKGGTVATPMPLHASSVLVKCPKCGKPTRRAFKIMDNGDKTRICKKCGNEF